ncbi:MAG TPA: hypothetical protein VGR19_12740 [Allosphingosinicella sp.]|nr:hypothetical protein [Allosphingosinicella sp.]
MSDAAFYRARAEEAKLEASQTSLEHVRAKCLRSAQAWIAMAERVEESERRRRAAKDKPRFTPEPSEGPRAAHKESVLTRQ